jgi:hypothetical protein
MVNFVLPPLRKNIVIYMNRDWVGPRAGLNILGQRKIPLPLPGFESRVVQSVDYSDRVCFYVVVGRGEGSRDYFCTLHSFVFGFRYRDRMC